ncbi:MAG TPA: rRNA adenine N-6-methyltransferase family protein, partial [Roseiarcus sp.]
MNRREFVVGAAAQATTLVARPALANVPTPYDWSASPPRQSREAFIEWMVKNRGEDPRFLAQRFDRFRELLTHHDVWDEADMRAFLLTPREEFVTAENLDRAYEWHHLNIGFGVTITGPHTVARMTNTLEIKRGDKVLEIGTGSGYQSAYLSNLTSNVWSIEIIPALAKR